MSSQPTAAPPTASQLPLAPVPSGSPSSRQPTAEELAKRYKLKTKYAKLQRKFHKATALRKDLQLEVSEKDEKVQRLQDEVNLILDQIYASDYAHLAPSEERYFSDDDEVVPAKVAPPSTNGANGAPTSEENSVKAEEEDAERSAKRMRVSELVG